MKKFFKEILQKLIVQFLIETIKTIMALIYYIKRIVK